ncbi:MAG: hypothetical protein AAF639_45215 [Chloroflexota bacterium]
MTNSEVLIDILHELYPDRTKNCIDMENDQQLIVYEGDDSRSYLRAISEDESDSIIGFKITNNKCKSIHLLAVDACFFHSSDEKKRCDCLIFDNYTLCFVELKTNARRHRATKRLKGVRNQIAASIQFFKTHILSDSRVVDKYELEAYVVMKDNVYPRSRPSHQATLLDFLEQYGVELFEQNTKSF